MQYKTLVITKAGEVELQGKDDSLNLLSLAFGVRDHRTEKSSFHLRPSTCLAPPLVTEQLDVVWLLD